MLRLINKIKDIKDNRYKQAFKTSIVSFLGQGIQMLTALISVPLVLNAVGNERYGLWMTLSSILLFVTFTDFGMGIGMQNIMSYAAAKNEKDKIKKSLSTTLAFGVILFIILSFLTYWVLPYIDLSNMIKYKDKTIGAEILPTTQAVFLVLTFGILGGLVQRAFDSLQEGYYPRIILVVSRIISLALLFWVVKTKQSLPVIIFTVNGIPNLMLLLGIIILYRRHSYLIFRFADIDKQLFTTIFKTGIVGLGAAIAIFLVNSITPVLISSAYGLNESAKYLVLNRLLNFILLFVNMMFLPLWPAIADAHSKKDSSWLNVLYIRLNKIFIIAGLPLFILLIFVSKYAILLWTHNSSILPSFVLIIACVFYTVLSVWNAIICIFLNGMSIFRGQATFGILIAIVSILVAHFLRNDIDSAGVVFIITAGMLIRCIYLHIELRTNMRAQHNIFLR